MLGAILMVLILVVILPIGMLVGGAVLAAIFGQALSSAKERDFEGSELVDLNK